MFITAVLLIFPGAFVGLYLGAALGAVCAVGMGVPDLASGFGSLGAVAGTLAVAWPGINYLGNTA